MFNSNIFIDGATWDPYRVKNILTISVEDKNVLSTISGFSEEKESSCVAQAKKDKPPVLEIQSVDTTETETQVTAEKIKWSKEKESYVAKIEKEKLSTVEFQSIDTIKTQIQNTVKEITSKKEILKLLLKFEAILKLRGKYNIYPISVNHSSLRKCKSLFCINNFKPPVLQLTRSSSLSNLIKTTECSLPDVSFQNRKMENFNLNQTYTVEYQHLKDNFKEVEILQNNRCEYLNKEVVSVIPANNQIKIDINKKNILDSTDKCNNVEHYSNLSESAFRINEYKMNGGDPNVKCDIDVPKQDELQETFTKSSAENFTVADKKMEIIPEAISLNSKLSVNENALEESVGIENKTSVSMFVQESKSDVRQDDCMISQEIPCAQPVSSDSNLFSSIGTSSQLVTEVHTVPSMDLKEHSQIAAVNVEPSVKSGEVMSLPSEKMSEAKVSRKRKHTKDKAQKSSSDSKSSRKPDIYYSSSELEKILSSLKLCLKLL